MTNNFDTTQDSIDPFVLIFLALKKSVDTNNENIKAILLENQDKIQAYQSLQLVAQEMTKQLNAFVPSKNDPDGDKKKLAELQYKAQKSQSDEQQSRQNLSMFWQTTVQTTTEAIDSGTQEAESVLSSYEQVNNQTLR
jgi:hypothetical protein